MERTSIDHRLLRTARGLHNNRAREAVLRRRIEAAEGALTEWLIASGSTCALLGLFDLHLEAGELHVTKRDVPSADQLPLPNASSAYQATPEQFGRGGDSGEPDAPRVAESLAPTRRLDLLRGLSEAELASLARAVLSSLATAEVAPLLARHEAGVVLSHPRLSATGVMSLE